MPTGNCSIAILLIATQRSSSVAGLERKASSAERSGRRDITTDQKRVSKATRKDNAYLEVTSGLPSH